MSSQIRPFYCKQQRSMHLKASWPNNDDRLTDIIFWKDFLLTEIIKSCCCLALKWIRILKEEGKKKPISTNNLKWYYRRVTVKLNVKDLKTSSLFSNRQNSLLPCIFPLLSNSGPPGCWSLSQQWWQGQRQGTPWRGRQSATRLIKRTAI